MRILKVKRIILVSSVGVVPLLFWLYVTSILNEKLGDNLLKFQANDFQNKSIFSEAFKITSERIPFVTMSNWKKLIKNYNNDRACLKLKLSQSYDCVMDHLYGNDHLHPVETIISPKTDANTASVLSKVHDTCIVVGSSDSLKKYKKGRAIDRIYSAIFRMNEAPVRGYEEYVGSRTTYRFVYPESAGTITELWENQTIISCLHKCANLLWTGNITSPRPLNCFNQNDLPMKMLFWKKAPKKLIYFICEPNKRSTSVSRA